MARTRILFLAFGAAVSIVAFMTINLRGDLIFALELRSVRLAALVQVGVAIALSTVVFQTVTANKILTPSIMGMDALYVLIQTLLVFLLGGIGFAALDDNWKFVIETLMMAGLATLLFLPILRLGGDLIVMLLTGVVLGVLFRSLSSLISRLIDPNDFAVVQNATYAGFNAVDGTLLAPCLILTAIGAVLCWRLRHVLDVMALGSETSIGLGVHWRTMAAGLLVLVGVLVSVSTALVGPVTFLGLLAVALAERLVGTSRHGPLFAGACLVATILLVGGQTFLTHALGNAVTIGVVIDLLGGIVFLFLLFSSRHK